MDILDLRREESNSGIDVVVLWKAWFGYGLRTHHLNLFYFLILYRQILLSYYIITGKREIRWYMVFLVTDLDEQSYVE